MRAVIEKEISFIHRPLAHLLSTQAIGAIGLGLDSRVGLIDTMSPTARHRYTFLRSCVAHQVLSGGDGFRYSLHVSAY